MFSVIVLNIDDGGIYAIKWLLFLNSGILYLTKSQVFLHLLD